MADSRPSAASPPSPSDSFYDISDEEEDEYKTIAQSRLGRGVKLLFSKSKVCQNLGAASFECGRDHGADADSIPQ